MSANRFHAWDEPTLERAAIHGCLDDDAQTGDPTVCEDCVRRIEESSDERE